MSKKKLFDRNRPCRNCPYRKDAPLQHWHIDHFQQVLDNEQEIVGKTFLCHKKDGCVCVGWLMDQDIRNHPCNALRMLLSKYEVTREYLDSLHSPAPMYDSVKEMCYTNYPQLIFTNKQNFTNEHKQ